MALRSELGKTVRRCATAFALGTGAFAITACTPAGELRPLTPEEKAAAGGFVVGVATGLLLDNNNGGHRPHRPRTQSTSQPKIIRYVPGGYITQSGPASRPRCHFRDGRGTVRRLQC